MTSANFQLSIVSADQRLPSQTVNIDPEWTAIDLKKYLNKVYPGEPPIDSQKLIFAGRILSDDSKLQNVIGQEPISRTVHLVLTPSVANQAKAAVAATETSDFTPEQIEQLKQQYLQYLNNYYENENIGVSTEQIEQGSEHGDDVVVEIDVNEGFQVQENGLQRMVRALGIGGDGEANAGQEQAFGVEEQVDLFDLAYAIFRISILIAVCVTYASWERIALVTIVGFIFYWRNGARQNAIQRQLQNPAAAPPPAPPQPAQPNASNADEATRPEIQSSVTPAVTGSEGGDVTQPSSSVEGPQEEQQEPPTRVRQIAQALRGAGETSYRLVYAIFASLVPELPARID